MAIEIGYMPYFTALARKILAKIAAPEIQD